MPKVAPSWPRLTVMVVFGLSCLGLLLFLWKAFGGTLPLGPKGYRVDVPVRDATQLAAQADVRVSGVTIGKVVEQRLDKDAGRTIATIEVEPGHAPIGRDVRAVLRQKTLLGETFVELTLGDGRAPRLAEGDRLAVERSQDHVELEDVLNTFDPDTREAFRVWQQDGGAAVGDRGEDLNAALANLPDFIESGDALLGVLAERGGATQRLIRDTGATFQALSADERRLRELMISVDDVLTATASQRDALAEIVRRFPPFLGETRRSLTRLDTFAARVTPTAARTADAFDRLPPSLDALAAAAPDVERALTGLEPLERVGRRALPDTRLIFERLQPTLDELAPFLAELNPILDWVGIHSHTLTDFLTNVGWGPAPKRSTADPLTPGHTTRQATPTGTETAAIWPTRLPSNRGNTHLNPLSLVGPEVGKTLIYPSSDCDNSGEKPATPGTGGSPACRVQPPLTFQGKRQGSFPHVEAAPAP